MQENHAKQSRQILDLSRRLDDLEDIFNTKIETHNEGRRVDGVDGQTADRSRNR